MTLVLPEEPREIPTSSPVRAYLWPYSPYGCHSTITLALGSALYLPRMALDV